MPPSAAVTAATDRKTVERLRRAGADTVTGPATIGRHLPAQSALGEETTEATAQRLPKDRPSLRTPSAPDRGKTDQAGIGGRCARSNQNSSTVFAISTNSSRLLGFVR